MTWALTSKVGQAQRKLVLWAYANHAHKDGRNAAIGKPTIAEYAECDEKTVTRHVKVLLRDGWMRLGDQRQVEYIRADRRPVVYDLAMSEATRLEWAAEHAANGGTGCPPVEPEPGDMALSPRAADHGGTSGASRGDKAVSPEPRTNHNPPTPASGEQLPACSRPGPRPHTNCRGCGTTNRQRVAAAERAAAERRRLDAAAAAAADRAKVGDRPSPAVLAGLRRNLAGNRTGAPR